MKSSKVIGAMVPYLLIIVGLAVMYQVAKRSGLTSALGGLTQRSASRPGAAAGAGIGDILGAIVSGPTTGHATGGGKGISGVNASPLAGSTAIGSQGSRVDLAPGPQTVTVPQAVIGGPLTGLPVGARVVEFSDARVNAGRPQLISLANGLSASDFGARLAR